MGETSQVHLHSPLRGNAEAGQINIFNHIAAVLPGRRLEFRPETEAERLLALACGGCTLSDMQEPLHARGLRLRRACRYPFWRIEAGNQRWRSGVARAAFDPGAPATARLAGLTGQPPGNGGSHRRGDPTGQRGLGRGPDLV